jgi:membrane protease YdiL (CAAX protease family)
VYHRSNSLWPGIILHFLINAFGLCATFASLEFQERYPDLVWLALRFILP